MFKRTLVILLLVSLIASNFAVYFVYAGFVVNQKDIAENVCVNKSRPWMHCNGKCYLKKKLQQAEEKEKKQDRDAQRNAFTLNMPTQPLTINPVTSPSIICYYPTQTDKIIMRVNAFFQPPKLSC